MDAEQGRPEAPSRKIRRISAYRFLALLILPAALLLGVAGLAVFLSLDTIRQITDSLEEEHLPGILDSQRTVDNINVLRSEAAVVFMAEDPGQRRAARLKVQALVAESVFEQSPEITGFAKTVQELTQKLDNARKRSDEASDALHLNELRLSGVLALLRHAAGDVHTLEPTHSSRHVTSPAREKDKAQYERARKSFEPMLALCRRMDLTPALSEDCAAFQRDLRVVGQAWNEKGEADQEALMLWRSLDASLQDLSNAASSEEFQRAYAGMEGLRAEARSMRNGFYISIALLAAMVLGTVAVLHRHILSPISLAAQELRQIRFGSPAKALPPVRIRELQQLLDLVPSLRGYLKDLAARSGALEQEKNKYENLSLVDALTGVPNRRSFDARLAQSACCASVGMLMIDVDLFKNYNDSLGHLAGDKCLVATARAMQATLYRHDDTLFRYGGEEFAVILEDVVAQQALAVAERIMDRIRSLRLPHPDSAVAPYVTVSIGVAVARRGEGCSGAELVARADKALYRAKAGGRDRICLYGDEDA